MKEKIIIFIVGLLLGAIISTGSIYFYTVANGSSNRQGPGIGMNGGTPPSMSDGQMPNNNSQSNSQTNNN